MKRIILCEPYLLISSSASGFSLFGVGKASNAFAASALGQANRAAMNSATTQITDRLRSVR